MHQNVDVTRLLRLRLSTWRGLIDVSAFVDMLIASIVLVQVVRLCCPMMEATLPPHEPHERLAGLRQVVVK